MAILPVLREFPRIYPPTLLSGDSYAWGYKVLKLPQNIIDLSAEAKSGFVKSLLDSQKAHVYRKLNPTEFEKAFSIKWLEIEKSIPKGNVHHILDTIDYTGKLALFIVFCMGLKSAL